MRRAALVLLFLALAGALSPAHARPPAQLSSWWSAPYEQSTYRVYEAYRVQIAFIEERGPDGLRQYTGVPTSTVVLTGTADEGDLGLANASGCWWITMRSDDPDVHGFWSSSVPCQRVYLPIVAT